MQTMSRRFRSKELVLDLDVSSGFVRPTGLLLSDTTIQPQQRYKRRKFHTTENGFLPYQRILIDASQFVNNRTIGISTIWSWWVGPVESTSSKRKIK